MPVHPTLVDNLRDNSAVETRLLVTWQDPQSRIYRPVGVLERVGHGYEFAYLRSADRIEGFRPFIGFPDLRRRYRSAVLFPIFAQRVMDPSRPDRPAWLGALGLDDDAPPFEILARSSGRRLGDTIELQPIPRVSDTGRTSCVFLIHGVRYHPGAAERIAALSSGDPLCLEECPDNLHNPRALLVTALDRQPLGWVPDPLVDYVHDVRAHGDPMVTVVRANGPEFGPHMRLLVRLEGTVPLGYRPFAAIEYQLQA